MKRILRKICIYFILLAFLTTSTLPAYALNKKFNQVNLSNLNKSASTSTITPKELLNEAIKDIKNLEMADPDQKPAYENRIEFAIFAIEEALDGNFENENSIKSDKVFDLTLKGIKKLGFYLNYPQASEEYREKISLIINKVIEADRLIVEILYSTIDKNIEIYPNNIQNNLKNAYKDYETAKDFESKNNREQAIHFYKKAWGNLQELKKEGLKIQDKDEDNCPDFLEEKLGLKKNKPDTDRDGLIDGFEVLKLMNLTDGLSEDTDKDGIPDSYEDPDNDGLVNIDEQKYGTNPLNPDTDLDGLTDKFEINEFNTQPLKYDTDSDGLSDGSELRLKTDPNNPDTDYDGIIDSLEEYTQSFTHDTTKTVLQVTAEGDISKNIRFNEIPSDSLIGNIKALVSEPVDIEVNSAFTAAKIFIPITKEKVPNNDIENVKMFYFDEEQRTMLPLDKQGIDLENGVVWAETNHFTTFALFYIPNWKVLWEQPLNKGERTVTTTTTYLDVVFVIDSSGSMSWNDPKGFRKTAAKSFVDALIQGDRAAVVDFDSRAYLTQSLTQDFNAVKKAIDRIDSSGGTDIGAGVRTANNELINKSSQERIKIEILLTDGIGNYNYSLTTQAKNNNIVIYTIGLGNQVNPSLLRSIAQGTNGMYFPVSSASQLPNVFSRISEIITEPVDTDNDGIFDSVETGGMRDGLGNIYYSDPNNPDTDNDGIPDGEETGSILSNGSGEYYITNSYPQEIDSDQDGLSDSEEEEYGTNPYKIDSDFDGLDDGLEILLGYDPLNYNPDQDSYNDKEEYENKLDPFMYDKLWYDHTADTLAGATCGDFGSKLVEWGFLQLSTFKSFGYLIGQIASGFTPFGDIRDIVASLVKLDFSGLLFNLLGFLPALGDAVKISDTLTSFIKRGPECIAIAARFIVAKLKDWQAVKTPILSVVLPFLCKNIDNLDILKRTGAADDIIAELAKHNDTAKIADTLRNTTKSVNIQSKVLDKAAISNKVDDYLKQFTDDFVKKHGRMPNAKCIDGIKAERIAIEAAKENYIKNGYTLLYVSDHGVNGPDLIFKKGDDILLVEAKGATKLNPDPTLIGKRLYTKKTGMAQLSFKWLETDYKRYINKIQSKDAFEEMWKIIDKKKKYKAAVVYAADNPGIKFGKDMDKYLSEIIEDTAIDSFELLKICDF